MKAWLRTYTGTKYIFSLVDEHHITLTNMKHDKKICGATCCLVFVIPFFAVLGFRFPYGTTIDTILVFVGILIFSIGAVMAIGIGLYCLGPKKTVFDVYFSQDHPIRVRVFHDGNMPGVQGDYNSFKTAILSQSVPGFGATERVW